MTVLQMTLVDGISVVESERLRLIIDTGSPISIESDVHSSWFRRDQVIPDGGEELNADKRDGNFNRLCIRMHGDALYATDALGTHY